jgi:N-formylglutamate amidohydrolase
VVDPERFEDDAREPMAQKGMGVIYTRTADGRPLRRRLEQDEREDLLERLYRPHHAALTTAVEAALALHDACLVVDAHSFPTVPLPYEDDQDPRRPDVCIGTDPLHTPTWLRDAAVRLCRPLGRVAVDRPFSGSLVPATSLGRDARVLAVMIEVNRGTYMDETTGLLHAGLEPTRRALRVVIETLIDIVGTRSVVST